MTRTDDALICFVLDQSGSMTPVAAATCEGFNQFKKEQQANPGQALMTLTLFNTVCETRYVGVGLDGIPDLGLSLNSYRPSGGTALFDAVAESIKRTEQWVSDHHWTGRVMVCVLTDGQENSSRIWHVYNPRQDGDASDVAGLIDWKTKEGWDFVFLGAGGTDWLERTFKEMPREAFYAFTNDSHSHRHTYGAVNAAVTQSRAGGQSLSSSLAEQDAETI